MKLNQNHVLFLLVALFLGYWVYSDLSNAAPRGRKVSGEAAEMVHYPAPNLGSLPAKQVDVASWPRDLFAPPRDTEPLAPLPFVEPPLEDPWILAPPGAHGPLAAYLAPGLRRAPAHAKSPILFAELASDITELLPEELAALGSQDALRKAQDELNAAIQTLEALDSAESRAALEEIRKTLAGSGLNLELPEMSPSEKLASYRKLYDWVLTPTQRFGHIVSADRYRLPEHPDAPILFVEVVPETGKEKFPGQAPIPIERARVDEFGFADNEANSIELERVAMGDPITAATQNKALALAKRCLLVSKEAPMALAMAKDLCEQVVALDQGQHLEGRLLQAQLYELNFEFENAFEVFHQLVASKDFGHRPDVLVAAGNLHARLGVWHQAEVLYRKALQSERTYYGAHLALGTLLLEMGQAQEAVEHLAQAEQAEPRGVESKDRRLEIRMQHGRGLLALGQVQAASDAFQRALAIDPLEPLARAGLVEAARLQPPAKRAQALQEAVVALSQGLVEAQFSLSLAQGLLAIEQGEWVLAKRYLELAVESDPFQSHLPLAALGFLADQTDHPDRAIEYLDRALEVHPPFAWALYTKGRILLEQGDLAQAETVLRKALELELAFPDALVLMGRLERERGDFDAARLYLERALHAEPDNAAWLTLAGFNAYSLGRADDGRKYFQKALEHDGSLAAAGLAEAWWHYMAKDSREAITRLGEWVEKRRSMGPQDPFVAYAEAQSARIVDHDSKELWTDRFERRPGRIGNGWSVKEGLGPTIDLQNGAVRIEGLFTGSGRTRIYNELSADAFLSMEARILIGPELRGSDVGLFLARERTGQGGDVVVQAEMVFQRNADGKLQYRAIRKGEEEASVVDLPGDSWPVGTERVLTLEKVGVGSEAYLRLYVGGEPVLERIPMPTLGTATQVLRFGLFVDGQANRAADVTMDDVRVVRRRL